MIFVELSWFNLRARNFLTDDELRKLQSELMENPSLAPVMPDCGGLRKLRWNVASRSKGKRGGCRVIYLNHPALARIDLVAIYGKDEQDTLTPAQKRELKLLAESLKREVIPAKGKKSTR